MDDKNLNEVLNVVKRIVINNETMIGEIKKTLDVIVSEQLIVKQQISEIRIGYNLDRYANKNNPNLIEETKSIAGATAVKIEEINKKIDQVLCKMKTV